MIVVAISSAIDWSAFATICSVTGSARRRERLSHGLLPLEHQRAGREVAPDRSSPAGTTTVVSYSSTSSGPGSAPAPIDARVRTGTSAAVAAEPHRSRREPLGHERVVDVEARASPADAAERREPDGTYLDRRARLAAHAVEPLVLVLEARAQRVRGGRCRPARRGASTSISQLCPP